jgi:hypothetical protein
MSHSAEMCLANVSDIVGRLGLEEVTGDGGDAFMVLTSEMSPDPVGRARLYRGEVTLVYVGLAVETIGLDSHMMFAFTPAGSAVPHFTVDSVQVPGGYAFHLDLIPRVDLGAHLGYMDHCYGPLTEVRSRTLALDGLTPADLSPRQWALMSEWMLANRCDEQGFLAVRPTVDAYREQWFSLLAAGVPADLLAGVDDADLARRDEANRAALFNPDVDKVWAQVERLVGAEQSEDVRLLLAGAATEVHR